tara:strand:+ start:1673 stop:2392 length:720 start_codon:yes stop_codon:yes gene_type:complete
MAQIRTHPNPPQITFPKRVGEAPIKAQITQQIEQVLQVLAPNMDFSEYTLPVHLTRASHSTQSADGMVGCSLTLQRRGLWESNTDKIYMNLKIANNSFDSLQMVLAHEMVHYVQYMTKSMYSTAHQVSERGRVTYVRHWNADQAQTIQRNVMNATTGLDFGSDYMPLLNAYLGCVGTPTTKRQRDYDDYLALPHETQAFRLTPLILKACGWSYSKDATRKATEARKASMKRKYPQAWNR